VTGPYCATIWIYATVDGLALAPPRSGLASEDVLASGPAFAGAPGKPSPLWPRNLVLQMAYCFAQCSAILRALLRYVG